MPKDTLKPHNTGVYLEPPRATDYVQGLVSGVPFETLLTSKNWKQYRSTGEKQYSIYFDSKGCVSFSFNNAVEMQINRFRKENILTDALVAQLLPDPQERAMFWEFFNDLKEADLSDRALAKVSGTTQEGNSLSWVAFVGRNKALPERVWPYPRDQKIPAFNWDDFYAPIPDDLIQKYSNVFFKVFTIVTEFIEPTLAEIDRNLAHAPVQIAAGYCPGWNEVTPVAACERHNDHATIVDGMPNQQYQVFDHYLPFEKILATDYKIDAALKIVVTIKKPITQPSMIVKDNYLYQLVEHPGGFALGLNGNLIIDDLAKILASWMIRNKGIIVDKTQTVNLADWNSVKHYNLKMEPVP